RLDSRKPVWTPQALLAIVLPLSSDEPIRRRLRLCPRTRCVMVRAWPVWLSSVLMVAGCLPDRQTVPMVNPNGAPPGPAAQLARPRAVPSPASQEAHMRVSLVGQRLLTNNRQENGLRPVFHTIGRPEAEVFHRGQGELFITEGLVKQCQTDGQLAAVL